ncbi:hypothetical protein ACFVYE_42905 [Streptomyces sp. NPDC058239]|uniref:hypothetical protein n=1 Tax=unclassified Streptomyces TaxID=2593676 RepID=UPI0036519653
MTSAVERVPGADRVKGLVDGVLDSVGIVSPHARRVAAYTGAGLLGVAGVVEWPVAMAGAAVVWLTQPRPKDVAASPAAGEARTDGLQAKRAARSAKAQTTARPARTRPAKASTTSKSKTAKKRPAKSSTISGPAKTRPAKASAASGTAKTRASKRAATSATGTSRAKAGGRKKS